MNKKKREIIIFVVLCLLISNVFWYISYANEKTDYAIFFMVIASFFPMILSLIMTKITKEGWNNLGVKFNIKKGWKIYLLSIIGTAILPYLTDALLMSFFRNNVSTTFAINELSGIAIGIVVGTACFIECLGEELGWIGYLFPRLEEQCGTIPACIFLGITRAMWHIGILVFMDFPVYAFVEIMLSNIFLQPFMVYMYKKSGSLFPCTISHGISNMLPIFIVYEQAWYYKSILPILVGLIPVVVYGMYGFIRMNKAGLLIKK